MIFNGRYSQPTPNNPLAPFVEAGIRATDGKWVSVFFLIDLGADGTYLPSKYIEELDIQIDQVKTEDDVAGVGGQRIKHVSFTTQLRFINKVKDEKIFDVEIGVFTQEEALDLPVLGRDVMNFFTLLCDARANLVWLMDEADRTKLLQFCDTIETR